MDGQIIDYGEVIRGISIEEKYNNWTSLENYRYYTDVPSLSPSEGIVIFLVIGVALVVVQRKWKQSIRKR